MATQDHPGDLPETESPPGRDDTTPRHPGSPEGPCPNPPLVPFWLGPLAVVAAALAMLCWTWGTWPDVLVDFGAQLEIPRQLAQGKVLYRDVASYNGPLSQYLNAAEFRLFGASLRTLMFCNLVILAGLFLLLYRAIEQVGHRWSAIAACLTFTLLFAFAQFKTVGNYNYVCPYAHEMTHGLVLSLAALLSVWEYPARGPSSLVVGGLALGLAFLTKAEVFLGGAAAVAVAAALMIHHSGAPWRRRGLMACTLAASALVPPLVAFALLCLALPAPQALVGTLGSWTVMAHPQVTELAFFRRGLGTDHPAENIGLMLTWTAWYAAALIPPAALGLALRKTRLPRGWVAAGTCAVVALALQEWGAPIPWLDAARPLPLLMLLAGTAWSVLLFRRRHDGPSRPRLIRRISLCVFALGLLAKMALNTRISHYGFVLAMPATLVLVVAVLDWLPAAVNHFGGTGDVLRGASLALLGTAVGAYLAAQGQYLAVKTETVGSGADAFLADQRGQFVNAALHEIAQLSSADETLTVFPEGAMLNYLSKRNSPVPYVNFMPTEFFYFGQDAMLAALRAHPPDWVVLVHKDTSEFGFPFFGQDYGQDIFAWIGSHYEPASLVGAPPLTGQGYGIRILRKKAGSTNRPAPSP